MTVQLESLQIDIRPGSYWAAVDLGQSLLRRYWRAVYLSWWGPWLVLSVLLWLCLPTDYLPWGTVAMWWLRPLFDRLPVYILSREVFGERVTVLQAWRAWRHQLGGWFRCLTWWRFVVVGRGLYVPVWMLEGARGKFAKQRRRALGARGAYTVAAWFGIACANFALVLEMALYGLVGLFMADQGNINPVAFIVKEFNDPTVLALSGHIVYTLADGLLGPVYAAGCFTLYLRRRAELEGWDIELALRRLAQRREGLLLGKLSNKVTSAVVVCALLLLAPHPDAHAATCPLPPDVVKQRNERGTPHDAGQAALRQQLDTLYEGDAWRTWDCEKTWVPKDTATSDDQDNWFTRFLKWLFDGKRKKSEAGAVDFSLVAVLLKGALIALLLVGLGWLLWRYRGALGPWAAPAKPRYVPPSEVCGVDIRPETLPDDVPGSVRSLWQAGRQREALGLLYRGLLSHLAHDHGVELHAGDTEGDVLRASAQACQQGQLPTAAEAACQSVTRVWRAIAYANQSPEPAAFEAAVAAWRTAFAGARQ